MNKSDRDDRKFSIPLARRVICEETSLASPVLTKARRAEAGQSIPERFEQIVELFPGRTAIKTIRSGITYEELNFQANRVARTLLDQCTGMQDRVAILVDDHVAAAIACVGILKAGKICVNIALSLPVSRIGYILRETQAETIITDEAGESVMGALVRSWNRRFNIADFRSGYRYENPKIKIVPDDIADIVYTSGSTGQPKGVVRTHRFVLGKSADRSPGALLDRVEVRRTTVGSSTKGALSAVLEGAGFYPWDLRKEGWTGLSNWMLEHRVTDYRSTPSVFRSFIGTLSQADKFPDLRVVRLSGEVITSRDVQLFKNYFGPDCILRCVLGTTETGSIAQQTIHHHTVSDKSFVTFSAEVPGKTILLLDEDLREVQFNQIGRIAVRSRYLAQAYWQQPELTQSLFLPAPEGGNERIYLTGDLGRRARDGSLEYLGRADHQVKIRGFRVEPAEIIAVLLSHPAIKDAYVLPKNNESNEVYLLAYVVLKEGAQASVTEIRRFLRDRLPEYMTPSRLVFLADLPLTVNCKVDIRALPDPALVRPELDVPFATPSTPVEKVLAKIWAEVLSLDCVGIDDDFFALGGHSLLAAKLFTRLDEEFGRSLPLATLLTASTVRLLAEHYREPAESRAFSALIPLRSSGTLPPIFAVPGVFGNVVGLEDLNRQLGADQPFYGLQAIGLDGIDLPLESIEAMARLYIREVRKVQVRGPYVLLGACFGAPVAYEMARQLTAAGEEVAFLGLLDPVRLKNPANRKPSVPIPWAYKRAKAVASLVADRLRLYGQEIRGHSGRERLNYLARKIRSLSGMVGHTKRSRGFARELYQLEVSRANHRASRLYDIKPITGRLKTFEIFQSSHPRNNRTGGVNWESLLEGVVVRHKVPGKDSGDMVSGQNARVLAVLLAEQIRKAIESPLCQHEVTADHRASEASPTG